MYGLAHAYKADLDVVPEIGHVMMLDEGWERAAKAIIAWLRKRSDWALGRIAGSPAAAATL
jgi:hypothetical protein